MYSDDGINDRGINHNVMVWSVWKCIAFTTNWLIYRDLQTKIFDLWDQIIQVKPEIRPTATQSLFVPEWSSLESSRQPKHHKQTAPLGATKWNKVNYQQRLGLLSKRQTKTRARLSSTSVKNGESFIVLQHSFSSFFLLIKLLPWFSTWSEVTYVGREVTWLMERSNFWWERSNHGAIKP